MKTLNNRMVLIQGKGQCQWEDADEVPFLKSLCDSENEYENRIIKEYEKGRETYYPIPNLSKLPDHSYLMIRATIKIDNKHIFEGYLSTSNNEVASITIWPKTSDSDFEVDLYKYDRLVADEENLIALEKLSEITSIDKLNLVEYSTIFSFSSGQEIKGLFRCV